MKWCRVSILFVCRWEMSDSSNSPAPRLTMYIFVGFSTTPRSAALPFSHRSSHATSDISKYSSSVLNRATVGCWLNFQLTAPPPYLNIQPVVNLLSSEVKPQSASKKPCIISPLSVRRLRQRDGGVFVYCRMWITECQCVSVDRQRKFASQLTANLIYGWVPFATTHCSMSINSAYGCVVWRAFKSWVRTANN